MNILDQALLSVGHFEFLAKQTVDGFVTGLHKSPYHGFSVEFSEHKQYNTGDSTRFVDWKVYAKTDKLFIKKFEEETNLRCRILIDISSSMYYPLENKGKITFSAFAAACLSLLLQKQRDAVGVSFFDAEVRYQSPIKSTSSHLRMICAELEKLIGKDQKNQRSHVSKAIHELAESIHKRSLVIIFSDMMDNSEEKETLFSSLQHLKYNKHEVLIFHVYDSQKEEEFEFENRPYEMIDLETGASLRLQPEDVRAAYRSQVIQHARETMLRCAQYKIGYVRADIQQGVEKVLESYLVKRSKMK